MIHKEEKLVKIVRISVSYFVDMLDINKKRKEWGRER